MRRPALVAAMLFLALAPAAQAADAPAFSADQRAAIEDIVKDYLTNKNPEIVMQAIQKLQQQKQAEEEAKSQQALTASYDKIYKDPTSPVAGNPNGDVTVIEFFDYQCGYCKLSEPSVEKLLKTDKNVKYIYKEYPILGPMSVKASKAALASVRQSKDKYFKFHDALLKLKDHLTDDLLFKTAKDVGLNVAKLKKDMEDPAIAKIIDDNQQLGMAVGARGTPTFIIGQMVNPGAMQYEQLQQAVDAARAAAKKK